MAVQVVYDGPRVPLMRGFLRVLGVLFGAILLLAAICGLALTLLVGSLLFFPDQWDSSERADAIAVTAIGAAVFVIALPIAVRLLRGRRRLVLFLRRFGFEDATQLVTFAAVEEIGRSWRVVTLDDSRVQAVGGSQGPRRLLALASAVLLAALAGAAWWGFGGGPDRLFDDVADSTTSNSAATTPAEEIGQAIGIALVAGIIAGLILLVIIVLAGVAAVSSLFSLFSYGKARGSELAKTAVMRTETEVAKRAESVARRSRRIFAPRLVVARVADPVWRQAVLTFARHCDAVIVDVSEASDNLRWEIQTLLPALGARCVLVGRADLLTEQQGDRTVFNPSLGRDLDGRTVLGYGTSRRDVRRFARALEGFLEATPSPRRA